MADTTTALDVLDGIAQDLGGTGGHDTLVPELQEIRELLGGEGIPNAVDAWLDAHPEATTTVQDGSITGVKIADDTIPDAKLAQTGGVLERVSYVVGKETLEFINSESLYVSGGTPTVTIDGNGFTSSNPNNVNCLLRIALPALASGNDYQLHFIVYAGPLYYVRVQNYTASTTYASMDNVVAGTYDLTFTAPSEDVYVFVYQRYNVSTIEVSDAVIVGGLEYNHLDTTLTDASKPAQGKAVGDRLNLFPSYVWLGYENVLNLSTADVITNIGNVVATIDGNSISLSNSSGINAGISFALAGLAIGSEYTLEFDSETDFSVSNQRVSVAVNGNASTFGDAYADFVKSGNHYTCTFRAIGYNIAFQIPLKYSTTSATLTNVLVRQAHVIEPQNAYCDYRGNDISTFNSILCIGDSLTYGGFNADGVDADAGIAALADKYSYPTYLEKLTGVNVDKLATSGVTSVAWWNLYQNEDTSGHDAAIIQLGVNDASPSKLNGWTQASITAFTDIINKLKSENNGIKIFVATTVPAPAFRGTTINEVNTGIRALVSDLNDPNVILADINTYGHTADSIGYDAGHLTAYGYNRLAMDYVSLISYIMSVDMANFRFIHFIGTEYTYTD